MPNEAKKAGLPEMPMPQDTSIIRNAHAYGLGSTDFISRRNKFLDDLDEHISDCVAKSLSNNFLPGPNAVDKFNENIPESPEEAFIAEVRFKACGSSDPNRIRLYSFNKFDYVMGLLSKRHRGAKTTEHAQSTPFFLDLVVKPISPDPTKEIEAPLLSSYKMLDRKAESSIRLGTKSTGRKFYNVAFGQDVAPYWQFTELSNVIFVTAKGMYYCPFTLNIL